MTALAGPRNTPRLGELLGVLEGWVKATQKIYKGSLVMIDNTTGYLVPGATATTGIAWGMADTGTENFVDTTGEASGAIKIRVEAGVFRWGNSAAADLIAQTEVGKDVYIVDDQTVAKTDGTGTRSVAGKVILVDSTGVYVKTGPF